MVGNLAKLAIERPAELSPAASDPKRAFHPGAGGRRAARAGIEGGRRQFLFTSNMWHDDVKRAAAYFWRTRFTVGSRSGTTHGGRREEGTPKMGLQLGASILQVKQLRNTANVRNRETRHQSLKLGRVHARRPPPCLLFRAAVSETAFLFVLLLVERRLIGPPARAAPFGQSTAADGGGEERVDGVPISRYYYPRSAASPQPTGVSVVGRSVGRSTANSLLAWHQSWLPLLCSAHLSTWIAHGRMADRRTITSQFGVRIRQAANWGSRRYRAASSEHI